MKEFAFFPPVAAALILGLASCGGDLTLPDASPGSLSLAVLDGNGQNGVVGQPLPSPVIVAVRTSSGVPLANRTVSFQPAPGSGGVFDPATTATNDQGQATTQWVLGTEPGPYSGEAHLVAEGDTAVQPVSLEALAVAGAPDTARADSPTLQAGDRGEPVGDAPVVVVVDRYGNPVEGAEVKWKVERGNGEISPGEDAVTDANGRSSVTWTLGNRIGVQQLTAEVKDVNGSPVTFTATILF